MQRVYKKEITWRSLCWLSNHSIGITKAFQCLNKLRSDKPSSRASAGIMRHRLPAGRFSPAAARSPGRGGSCACAGTTGGRFSPSSGAAARTHTPSSPSGRPKHRFSFCYRATHTGWEMQLARLNRKCCRAAQNNCTEYLQTYSEREKQQCVERAFTASDLPSFWKIVRLAWFICGLFTTSHCISIEQIKLDLKWMAMFCPWVPL